MATDFDDQYRAADGKNLGLAIAALAPVVTAVLVTLYFRASLPVHRATPIDQVPARTDSYVQSLEAQLAELKVQAAPGMLALAREQLAKGDQEAARGHAQSATRSDPSLMEAYLVLGQALAATKQFRDASRALKHYLEVFKGEAHQARQLLELCQRGELAGASPTLLSEIGMLMGRMGLLSLASHLLNDVSRLPYLYGSHLRAAWNIRSGSSVARMNEGSMHIDLRGLSDRADQVSDLSSLAGMRINSLVAPNLINVRDISVLRGMDLHDLNLDGGSVRDLGPLQGMSLLRLGISRCPVDSLHPLAEAKLERLNAHGTQISDLTPLQGMPLEWLDVSGSKVWTLEALSEAPLHLLNLISTKVADLAPVAKAPIRHLDIRGTQITDLAPIADMPLEFLAVNAAPITDLSPIAGKPLRIFGIDINTELDLSVLDTLPNLKKIVVNPSNVEISLARFREFRNARAKLLTDNPQLQSRIRYEFSRDGETEGIVFERTNVEDISGLEGLNVHQLRILDNPKLTDLSPLAGMPLRILYVTRSSVADISVLRDMHTLRSVGLSDSKVSDISPLAGKQIDSLSINDSEVTDLTPLKDMTSLRHFSFSPHRIEEGLQAIRELRSIESIGPRWESRMPSQQFWQRWDAGEFRRKR